MILKFRRVGPDALARLLNFTETRAACQPVIEWNKDHCYLQLKYTNVITVLSFKKDEGVTSQVVLKVADGVNSFPSRWAERPVLINPNIDPNHPRNFKYEGEQGVRPVVERFDVPGFGSMPDFELPNVEVRELNAAIQQHWSRVGITVQDHVVRGIYEALGIFQPSVVIVMPYGFSTYDLEEKEG